MSKEDKKTESNSTINITLQGKGGVGKTFVSYILAQYYISKKQPVRCIDTDPVNHSLSKFKTLKPNIIDVIDNGELQPEILEELLLGITQVQDNIIIDVGSTGFVPIINFLEENDTLSSLETTKKINIHTVVMDKEEKETLAGVETIYNLTKVLPNVDIVVWRNDEGVSRSENFTLDNLLKPFKDKIKETNIIHISSRKEVFARTIKKVTTQGYTLEDVLKDPNYNVFDKQRVKTFLDEIFIQLDKLGN